MKHALTIAILSLLLLPLALAEAPTLAETGTLNLTGYDLGGDFEIEEIGNNMIAVFGETNVAQRACKLTIYQRDTGNSLFTHSFGGGTIFQCNTRGLDLYNDQLLVSCGWNFRQGGTPNFDNIYFYDVSDEGFIYLKNGTSTSETVESGSLSCDFMDSDEVLYIGAGNALTYDAKITGNTLTLTTITGAATPTAPIDTDNERYAAGTTLYEYENDILNHTVIGSTSYGNLIDHDKQNTPTYISNDGHITIVGNPDYASLASSGNSLDFTPLYIFSRENILGIVNDTWVVGDFSDATNPLTDLTGEAIDINCTGGCYYDRGNTEVTIFNTLGDYAIYEAETQPTCSIQDACYLDEPFNYADSLLNNGWNGWNTQPFNGELKCFSSSQYNYYDFEPVTKDTGTITVDFDATICGDSTAYLNMYMGDGSNVALELWMKGDSLDGTIQDHNWNFLSYSIGNSEADPGNYTCSGNKLFNNHYTIAVHPQNNPKTYDVYVNDVLVAGNNEWTNAGQGLNELSFIYFGGGYAGTKCAWYVDNIQIYGTDTGEELNITELEEERNKVYGLDLNTGAEDPFDDEALCAVDENRNFCFLRVIIGGILNSMWRAIINNPLESLAAILLIVVVIVTAVKTKK